MWPPLRGLRGYGDVGVRSVCVVAVATVVVSSTSFGVGSAASEEDTAWWYWGGEGAMVWERNWTSGKGGRVELGRLGVAAAADEFSDVRSDREYEDGWWTVVAAAALPWALRVLLTAAAMAAAASRSWVWAS